MIYLNGNHWNGNGQTVDCCRRWRRRHSVVNRYKILTTKQSKVLNICCNMQLKLLPHWTVMMTTGNTHTNLESNFFSSLHRSRVLAPRLELWMHSFVRSLPHTENVSFYFKYAEQTSSGWLAAGGCRIYFQILPLIMRPSNALLPLCALLLLQHHQPNLPVSGKMANIIRLFCERTKRRQQLNA